MIRPDYILSYWILAWYICYMLGLLSHNPKLAIQLGLIENIMILIAMIYYQVSFKQIVLFTFLMIVYKVIPLWTIRNTKTTRMDIQATIGVVLMYIGWLLWEEEIEVIYQMLTDMFQLQNKLPGMYLLNKLF